MNPLAAATALAVCLLAAGPASAQLLPPAGISVQGHGVVRRPADVMRFAIVVGDRQNPAGGLSGADALVAALKRLGVDDAAVATPFNNMVSAQSFATVVGSVRKPTPAGVRALVLSVQSALPPNAVAIQNVNFALALDDCSDAETIADQAALDDARRRAQRLAAAAGVALGPPLAVNEQYAPAGPCPTKPDRQPFTNQQFEAFPSADSFDVIVAVTTNVTFAIR